MIFPRVTLTTKAAHTLNCWFRFRSFHDSSHCQLHQDYSQIKGKGLCDSIPKTFFLIYWERLCVIRQKFLRKQTKNPCQLFCQRTMRFSGCESQKVYLLFSSQCLSAIQGFFNGFIETDSQWIPWIICFLTESENMTHVAQMWWFVLRAVLQVLWRVLPMLSHTDVLS